MVSKQCAACGEYFAGELNGDYICPACRQAGAVGQVRALAQLDSLAPGAPSPAAPRSPQGGAPGSVTGQAA